MKIDTLEQLEIEQEKLKMKIAITKDAFSKSLGSNRKELKNFMMKKVALPTGLIGLGTLAIKQLTDRDKSKTKKDNSPSGINLKALLPIGMNLLQTYLLQKQNHQTGDSSPSNST